MAGKFCRDEYADFIVEPRKYSVVWRLRKHDINFYGVAQNTEGITAIIDGHSHESYVRVVQNKRGQDVLLAQAGTKLNSVGEIRLTAAGTLSAKLHTLAQGKDAAAAKIISQEMEAYAPLLTQPVGEALVQLYASDPQTGARLVRRQDAAWRILQPTLIKLY